MSDTIRRISGGMATLSGGTRRTLDLDRPWQNQGKKINPSTCPFCTKNEQPISRHDHGAGGKWKVLQNLYTPYEFHRLVMPEGPCWPENELRVLGGPERLAGGLKTVREAMPVHDAPRECVIGINVGDFVRQTIGHFHIHVTNSVYLGENTPAEALTFTEDLVVFRDRGLTVVADGFRAGQCFIQPETNSGFLSWTSTTEEDLAYVLHRLVVLGNEKFRSLQGFPPDFTIGIEVCRGMFSEVLYTPILTHPGFPEMLAVRRMNRQQAFTLPWPHKVTAKHLRGEI